VNNGTIFSDGINIGLTKSGQNNDSFGLAAIATQQHDHCYNEHEEQLHLFHDYIFFGLYSF
ncbi:hypothetical protein JXE04_02835, partial [Patescibacteria group bacterium]|nr:hypothetical protein [Patescibacteria group bacterium]